MSVYWCHSCSTGSEAIFHDNVPTCGNCNSDFVELLVEEEEPVLVPLTFNFTTRVDGPINFTTNNNSGVDIRQLMIQTIISQLQQHFEVTGDYVGEQGLYCFLIKRDGILERLMEEYEREHRPPAATQETLDSLPILNFSDDLPQKECPVCQDEYEVGKEILKLPCNHTFHPKCIKDWLKLNGTCPVCRFSLVKSETADQEQDTSLPPQDQQSQSQSQGQSLSRFLERVFNQPDHNSNSTNNRDRLDDLD